MLGAIDERAAYVLTAGILAGAFLYLPTIRAIDSAGKGGSLKGYLRCLGNRLAQALPSLPLYLLCLAPYVLMIRLGRRSLGFGILVLTGLLYLSRSWYEEPAWTVEPGLPARIAGWLSLIPDAWLIIGLARKLPEQAYGLILAGCWVLPYLTVLSALAAMRLPLGLMKRLGRRKIARDLDGYEGKIIAVYRNPGLAEFLDRLLRHCRYGGRVNAKDRGAFLRTYLPSSDYLIIDLEGPVDFRTDLLAIGAAADLRRAESLISSMSGLLVIPGDQPVRTSRKYVSYGFTSAADYQLIPESSGRLGTSLVFNEEGKHCYEGQARLFGSRQLGWLALGLAVGRQLGIPVEEILREAARIPQPKGRLDCRLWQGRILIDGHAEPLQRPSECLGKAKEPLILVLPALSDPAEAALFAKEIREWQAGVVMAEAGSAILIRALSREECDPRSIHLAKKLDDVPAEALKWSKAGDIILTGLELAAEA